MADEAARVEAGARGDLDIARIIGEVDLSNAEDIAKGVEAVIGQRDRRHAIDLTDTTYFDSAGIRMLFSLATRLRERGEALIVIVPLTGVVRRIVDLTDVAQVCEVFASLDAVPGE